jgi:hypothetical protein
VQSRVYLNWLTVLEIITKKYENRTNALWTYEGLATIPRSGRTNLSLLFGDGLFQVEANAKGGETIDPIGDKRKS